MKGATESVPRFCRTAIALRQEAFPFVCARWMGGVVGAGAGIILPNPHPPSLAFTAASDVS